MQEKMMNLDRADFNGNFDAKFQYEQSTLRDDMKTYIRMHYELKEEMMDYFLVWL